MIIVSSLHYDIVSILWTDKNHAATIETEKAKVIEEKGLPYREFINENGNLNMVYDSWNSVIIVDTRD